MLSLHPDCSSIYSLMDRIGDSGSLGEGSIPSRCTKKPAKAGFLNCLYQSSFYRFYLQKAFNLILNFLFRFSFHNVYSYFSH